MDHAEEGVKHRRRLRLPLRRPRWGTVISGFILMLLLLVVIIWTQRRQLATDFIERELERRGVEATYKVARVGFRTQRLADVVIGDPKRPDLTAEFVEVKISWGLRRPEVGWIKARGVRIFGQVKDGEISLGEVDKLLPPKTGAPFRFPDLNVDVADTAIALDTPAGRLAVALEGRGNLADGFRGEMAARSSSLMLGGCAIDDAVAYAKVAMVKRHPNLNGPFRADRILCPKEEIDITRPQMVVKARVPESFDSWRGEARVQVPAAIIDENAVAGVRGLLTFNGNNELTRGRVDMTAAQARIGEFRTGRTTLDGRYAANLDVGDLSLIGETTARNVVGAGPAIRPVVAALSSAKGTPVGALGEALAGAVTRAARGFDARAVIRLVSGDRYGAVRADRLSIASQSGARLGVSGGDGITYYWKGNSVRFDGEFGLTGGGFPATRVSIDQPRAGGAIEGVARIEPFAAGDSRLALAPVRFRAGKDGNTRIDTSAVLSGPFKSGYVRDLALPINGFFGKDGFAFGEGCINASFRSLRIAGLTLGSTRLPLCPTGRALVWRQGDGPVQGGTDLRSMRLAGRLGNTPITIASDRVRFNLGDPSFTGSNVAVRLGRTGSVNRFDIGQLSGRFTNDGAVGTFAGGDVKLASVPLLVSNGNGRWRVVNGDDVYLDGGITVSDIQDPPRFWPLVSNDFTLSLIKNEIKAGGTLTDPDTGTRVALASIDHSLTTSRGNAVLDVPGITFNEDYQPEELTRLTTGVVALVNGTLTGEGRINWSPEGGTTSTGTFSTTDMDLAAPFGPIEGLTTTLNFTDLLGLTTAPGQVAQIDVIQTGINVVDGTIRYQLLPDQKIRVESGVWPFMGGRLVLEETLLDFSQPSTKRLTFQVIGLNAQTFIREMDFKVVDATGIFDGVLPMEFDANGGRIVGGRLEARPPGGILAYVGEVSRESLGTFGFAAFQALRSLRYDKFIINLDGSLEGEFLAGIELDGIATNNTQKGIVGYVINQLAKLRFEFNINIRGPFRALIATARSLGDPSVIIQDVLPPELQGLPVEVIEQKRDTESTTGNDEAAPTIQKQEREGVK
ncbi:MAG TPA: YdbH domain-containing protein [Allosphingosinicella sp.]|nr:YdbH domain-containing protein [Allosphingosinicella sp.]